MPPSMDVVLDPLGCGRSFVSVAAELRVSGQNHLQVASTRAGRYRQGVFPGGLISQNRRAPNGRPAPEPIHDEGRRSQMRNPLVLVLTVLLAACDGSSSTTTGVDDSSAQDPVRLVAELEEDGSTVEEVGTFSSEPLGGSGQILCVNAEEVRVYLFGSEELASSVAARIDPNDPSNLGNAMVEWVGTPRFWQRGPMLVLYLGDDQAIENSLSSILGEPFARGVGPGRGLAGLPNPCEAP